MTSADAGVEVAKDNKLIRVRHRRQEGAQVHVEYVPCGVRAGRRRSVHADDGEEFAPTPERQTEAHQAIIYALRQTGQPSPDVVPDGEGDTRVSSLRPGATASEAINPIFETSQSFGRLKHSAQIGRGIYYKTEDAWGCCSDSALLLNGNADCPIKKTQPTSPELPLRDAEDEVAGEDPEH
nr:unnamed protein product [Spirometra erinaceieuropaei]